VAGLAYLGGTGTDHEYRRNTIHVTVGAANAGYGIFTADTASTTRSFYNHIHVEDIGGLSYGFLVGLGATLISQLDDIVAADGNTVTGTFTQVNSPSDGDFSLSGALALGTALAPEYGGSGQSSYVDGQVLIGNTIGNTLGKATLTAGVGVAIANGGSSITINAAGGGITWSTITGATAGAIGHGYFCNHAVTRVVVTLPDTAAVGDIIRLSGVGVAGWEVAQNAGETIYMGSLATTTGVIGKLQSTDTRDCIELVCFVANTDWQVLSSMGNITVT